MPKPKVAEKDVYARMRIENPNTFRADDTVLFRLACDEPVVAKQKFQVKQSTITLSTNTKD